MGTMTCDYGQEFHSHRVGGYQFLLLDGNVQLVSEELHITVFCASISITGSEVISEF